MNTSEDLKMGLPLQERLYKNNGNLELIRLLDANCRRVLDVGCGAGDNAALIRSRIPCCAVSGVTYSPAEAEVAQTHLEKCWVTDVEADLPHDLAEQSFDAVIFCHVLEHLRNPDMAVARLARLLPDGGQVLIAVPNIMTIEMRLRFLRGDFHYESSGIMDNTHLHFYTYYTADRCLLGNSPDLRLVHKSVGGHVPLPILRKHILPERWSASIDEWGMRRWPNLFGWQTLLKAEKVRTDAA